MEEELASLLHVQRPHIVKMLAPPAPRSPWSSPRRGTAGDGAVTWPQRRGRQLANSVWRRTFPPPARISLEPGAGRAEALFWRCGKSALNLT